MMKTTSLLIPALALACASCGSDEGAGDSGEPLDSAEVAERARDAIKPQAGLYRSTMELVEVDIPGAEPGMVDMMRGMMGGQEHEYCLTQEEVDRGYEEMARQSQDENCTYERFEVDGGDIDAAMTCAAGADDEMRMTMSGSATSTSMEMDMTMSGNMTGMGEGTLQMKTSHERIGDCP